MGVAEIITLLTGLFQFPAALLKLIRALQSTPEENREKLVKEVGDTLDRFQSSGRPEW